MFRHILLPLDGSKFSELALPYALAIANNFDSEITLLRVVQQPQTGATTVNSDQVVVLNQLGNEMLKESDTYLRAQRDLLRQQGYKTNHVLNVGDDAAEHILSTGSKLGTNLIVMSTHGRGGLKRWIFGSVAEKVLRHATCPILLVRADETAVSDWKVGTSAL